MARAQQPDATFSSDVNVVNLFATVHDKKGKIVRDLSKDDFFLKEDDRPQTIRYFTQESNLPLTIGLLIDSSMSQRRVLGQERAASYKFFEQVLREDKDQGCVIHFDREVELLQDVTSSRAKLEKALGEIEDPVRSGGWNSARGGGRHGGGTALYDSVLLASDEIMKKQTGRKALIVLSDGVDVGSKMTLADSIESAQRADALVYSILFSDEQFYGGSSYGAGPWGGRHGGGGHGRGPNSVRRPDGKHVLMTLANETGGGFFEVSKKQPIQEMFRRIEEELRNQYSIGYTPDRANAGPGFRKIELTAKKKEFAVRTREGYYAR